MCFGSKTTTKTNQTQKTDPYGPVSGVLSQGAGVMGNYLSNPGSNAVYSGPRVADLSSDTQNALGMMRNSSGANSAMDFFSGVMNGGAGGMNPQVQQMQDAIRRQVMANNNATFSSSGMTGGTAHQESLAKGLADGLAQPLFAAYENDMGRKMSAAGAIPGLDQQRISNQLGAGEIMDSYNQSKINADRQFFDETRTAPMKAWGEVAPLAIQMGSAFPTSNMKGSSVTKQGQSLGSSILGGAMMAAGAMTGMPQLGMAGMGAFGGGAAPTAPWTFSGQKYASNGSFDLNSLLSGLR